MALTDLTIYASFAEVVVTVVHSTSESQTADLTTRTA